MSSSADAASSEVRSCIILAAGEGRRLSPLQNDCPKPAIEILGLSLGERSVAAGMAAGMRRFIVVLGSQAEAVRAHFEQVAARRGCTIEFVMAEDWKLGNGASALAVRNRIRSDPFLLVMADHVIAPQPHQAASAHPSGQGGGLPGSGLGHRTGLRSRGCHEGPRGGSTRFADREATAHLECS